MAHTCNPNYSGGRDQEDHGSKSAYANSFQDPNLKKKSKKGLVEWPLSSNPSTAKKKKDRQKKVE
jgi:hypothetical protein